MNLKLCCETDYLVLLNGTRVFLCPVCNELVEEEE